MLNSLLRLARPSHWIKNLVVLLPVIFAVRMDDVRAWAQAALAASLAPATSRVLHLAQLPSSSYSWEIVR